MTLPNSNRITITVILIHVQYYIKHRSLGSTLGQIEVIRGSNKGRVREQLGKLYLKLLKCPLCVVGRVYFW